MSCSPDLGSPSNSIGMLNGTGASVSISSINCVFDFILEFLPESTVTKPNNPSAFPSLIISPIIICMPDNSITSTLKTLRSISPLM